MRLTRVIDAQRRTFLARIEDDHVVPLWPESTWPGADPLRELLAGGDVDAASAVGEAQPLEAVRLLAPLAAPQKVIAVGLNYADHARDRRRDPVLAAHLREVAQRDRRAGRGDRVPRVGLAPAR